MNRVSYIVVMLIVFVSVLVLNTGCEEEKGRLDDRQNRLFADENIRLNAKLKRLNKQLEKQKKLLEDCRTEQQEYEENAKMLNDSMMYSFSECREENLRLRQEIEDLEARLE